VVEVQPHVAVRCCRPAGGEPARGTATCGSAVLAACRGETSSGTAELVASRGSDTVGTTARGSAVFPEVPAVESKGAIPTGRGTGLVKSSRKA
jgi:hypothetical protein